MTSRFLLGLSVLGGLVCAEARAQTHVVKAPETVVRAVAVYEWTGEVGKATASRLVPVSIFIDGQLQDAGVYLARPVPFALQRGTIFDVERAGVETGTIELAYAKKFESTGDQPVEDHAGRDGRDPGWNDGWLAYGALKLKPREPLYSSTNSPAKKSGPLPQIAVNGGKGPRFSKPAGTPEAKPEANGADTSGEAKSGKTGVDRSTAVGGGTTVSAAGQPTKQTSGQGSTDEVERPSMRHKAGQDGAGAADASTTNAGAATADSTDDADRPTLKKRTPAQTKAAQKTHDQASVTGGKALNDDPDRPVLHRGKAGGGEDHDLPALRGLPREMHQAVAVSDAVNRAEHPFKRDWESDAERAEVLRGMQEIARAQLAAGGAGGSGSGAGARSGSRAGLGSGAHARLASKARGGRAADASAGRLMPLTEETLKGFTLSYGGAATYSYAASSSAVGGASSAAGAVRQVWVIAQQEPAGELKVALAGVTDAAHLDQTPWLRLVDAVDADASNRASLLFEVRSQTTRQFALYRVIGAQAEQVFATGN